MIQKTLLTERKYESRKTARTISTRAYNHVVLKSQKPILRKNSALIKRTIADAQNRFGFRLKSFSIMPDHVHLLIQVRSRESFANSLRFLAGQIALKIGKGKLWRQRLWSRAVTRGRDFLTTLTYVSRNALKAGLFNDSDTFILWQGKLTDLQTIYDSWVMLHIELKKKLEAQLGLEL